MEEQRAREQSDNVRRRDETEKGRSRGVLYRLRRFSVAKVIYFHERLDHLFLKINKSNMRHQLFHRKVRQNTNETYTGVRILGGGNTMD